MLPTEQEFFIQMTTRICSSLDIRIALHRVFEYLNQLPPRIDRIFLHLYERNLIACRTVCEVTATTASYIDVLTPLTDEGKIRYEDNGAGIRIVAKPDDDPIVKYVAESLKLPHMSSIVLRLVVEGKLLGSLLIGTNAGQLFTEQHMKLLATVGEPFAMALSNALKFQEVYRLKERLTDDNNFLSSELLSHYDDNIIGSETGLKHVMNMARRVAVFNSPVVLLGETGVGKGIIAKAIHRMSPRQDGPFIVVNSGAITDSLMDSELFGHERGSFTGAIEQKRGRFERADHGTIFLDEIGEMPFPIQVRMLRVFQEKVIERVGGTKPIPVDVRIIAATHRNLEEMVKNNQFRQDLWFRLNIFPIYIPPLRDRRGDIPLLVDYYIQKKSRDLKLPFIPKLAPGAIQHLMDYPWPGNVRELDNVIERELISCSEEVLTFKRIAVENSYADTSACSRQEDGPILKIDEVLRSHILHALKAANGVIHGPNGAAKILEINPSTLRSRMEKMGILYGKQSKNNNFTNRDKL